MENDNITGTRILELLAIQGLTQRELADMIGITEVSMSRYIRGDRTPKGPTIMKIADALRTSSDFLLGHEVQGEDPELEYYRTQRAVARNAKKWTAKQKADLVNALFEV